MIKVRLFKAGLFTYLRLFTDTGGRAGNIADLHIFCPCRPGSVEGRIVGAIQGHSFTSHLREGVLQVSGFF